VSAAGLLQAIWQQARDDVLGQVDVIADAITDALAGALDDAARERAAREAHKLVGSLGTLGFGSASETARALELALRAPGGAALGDLPRLAELVIGLRAELEVDRPEEPRTTPARPVSDGRPTVLFIDDQPQRSAALLREAASRSVVAASADDLGSARRILTASEPEVVVLELSTGGDLEAVMGFLSDVSERRAVMVVNASGREVDRLEIAGCGGRGLLTRSREPREIVAAALDLHDRVRVRGTRVLAVDDDPTFLAALTAVLELAGLTVVGCGDPRHFWDRLEQVSPDLVVLDFDMPEVSGPQLCRAMRNDARWAGVPVVFLTSRHDPASVQAVFDAGADDYLSKPFVGPEVLARIGNRLERVRLYATLAERDGLTGLANRRKSLDSLESMLSMAERESQPVTMAIADVDSFKAINDKQGHGAGDAVLRELGAMMLQFFRAEDVVTRWGGDEFVIAMYGLGNADARQRLGEFVEEVRSNRFHRGRVEVTLSVGVAEHPAHGMSIDELYQAADAALYVAKAEGRDRVVPAGRDPNEGPDKVDVAIVEDDAVLGQLLQHALQTRGYRTSWIDDGLTAGAELGSAEPRLMAPLLLLDWDLPGLDGLRLLRTLRERGVLARTRVIMLTARGTEDEVLEALEAGAVDHVTKPFSIPVLMQRVRRALER
jgi:diguanylate cyclase (GGDEF)-like protein